METQSRAAGLALTPTLIAQAATCGVALVIGETLYKFKSFTLEALAFLATWGLLYAAVRPFLKGR